MSDAGLRSLRLEPPPWLKRLNRVGRALVGSGEAGAMGVPLDVPSLLDEARRNTGLDDFGPDDVWREGPRRADEEPRFRVAPHPVGAGAVPRRPGDALGDAAPGRGRLSTRRAHRGAVRPTSSGSPPRRSPVSSRERDSSSRRSTISWIVRAFWSSWCPEAASAWRPEGASGFGLRHARALKGASNGCAVPSVHPEAARRRRSRVAPDAVW